MVDRMCLVKLKVWQLQMLSQCTSKMFSEDEVEFCIADLDGRRTLDATGITKDETEQLAGFNVGIVWVQAAKRSSAIR